MPALSLASKLKLRTGHRAALVNAPGGYRKEMGKVPAGVKFAATLAGTFDWIQLFAKNRTELERLAPRATRALRPEGILWV